MQSFGIPWFHSSVTGLPQLWFCGQTILCTFSIVYSLVVGVSIYPFAALKHGCFLLPVYFFSSFRLTVLFLWRSPAFTHLIIIPAAWSLFSFLLILEGPCCRFRLYYVASQVQLPPVLCFIFVWNICNTRAFVSIQLFSWFILKDVTFSALVHVLCH